MSTADICFYDFVEVRQLKDRTAPPSKFMEIGKKLRRLTQDVERNWESLPIEHKKDLKECAEEFLKAPEQSSTLFSRLRVESYMFFVKITGQEKAFSFCLNALDSLIDAILDATERESPTYQQALSDTLEELTVNKDAGKLIDAGKRREWLRSLSD